MVNRKYSKTVLNGVRGERGDAGKRKEGTGEREKGEGRGKGEQERGNRGEGRGKGEQETGNRGEGRGKGEQGRGNRGEGRGNREQGRTWVSPGSWWVYNFMCAVIHTRMFSAGGIVLVSELSENQKHTPVCTLPTRPTNVYTAHDYCLTCARCYGCVWL